MPELSDLDGRPIKILASRDDGHCESRLADIPAVPANDEASHDASSSSMRARRRLTSSNRRGKRFTLAWPASC